MKNWQIQIGFWGTIAWISLIFNLEVTTKFSPTITKSITGYIAGFITVISGHLFWQIVKGRHEIIFGDEKGIFRILSTIPFLVMFIFGTGFLLVGIFGSAPWQYNLWFIIAGIAVNQGVIPIIDSFENTAKKSLQ